MQLLQKRILPVALRRVVPWLVALTAASASAQIPFGPPLNLPPVAERRAEVLKDFDKDGDGKLSIEERDLARQAWAKQMLGKREAGFFRPPPELMEEFDLNKDDEIDEEEGRKLQETLGRRFEKLNKDYDRNGNGRLDEEEIDAASKDIDEGKLKGIPKMFLQFSRGGPRGRQAGPPKGQAAEDLDPVEILKAADKDGDGRLNAEELQRAREGWAKRRAAKLKSTENK